MRRFNGYQIVNAINVITCTLSVANDTEWSKVEDCKGSIRYCTFSYSVAIDISLCKSNPCLNGGKCTDVGDAKFECNCIGILYKGATCDILCFKHQNVVSSITSEGDFFITFLHQILYLN